MSISLQLLGPSSWSLAIRLFYFRANPPPGRGRKNKKREREKREKRGKRREKRKGKGKEGKERMLGRVCEPLIADLGLEMLTFNDDGLGNRKGRL
jgi:hypothetical protein